MGQAPSSATREKTVHNSKNGRDAPFFVAGFPMDYRSLSNALAVFRAIKLADGNWTPAQLIHQIASADQNTTTRQTATLKIASYILEQIEEAKAVIAASGLDEEAKEGVNQSLIQLGNAFSLGGLNTQMQSTIQNVPGAISSIVILLSASGIETNTHAPQEAVELASQVEGLMGDFESDALDPLVRDLARQHLQILATLLRHIPVFGLEAAMASYFELVIKIRRADANTSEEQKKAVEPLMEKLNGLQKGLGTLDKIWNEGARWIARGKVGLALLGFIPS